jgi:hypothetical protein
MMSKVVITYLSYQEMDRLATSSFTTPTSRPKVIECLHRLEPRRAGHSRASPTPHMPKLPVSRRTSGRCSSTISICRCCFLVYDLSHSAISPSIAAPQARLPCSTGVYPHWRPYSATIFARAASLHYCFFQ